VSSNGPAFSIRERMPATEGFNSSLSPTLTGNVIVKRRYFVLPLFALIVGFPAIAQDTAKSPLDKLDAKKVPAALRPKGTPADVFAVLGDRDGRYDSIAFRPDGAQMAVGGPDGIIRIWDLATLKVTGTTTQKEIVTLTYSQSGRTLAAGDSQGNLKFFTITNGRPDRPTIVPAHKGGPVWAVAFSADGKLLFSAGADKTVKVWDASTIPPKLKSTLTGHEDRVRGLSPAPDGKLLASTSDRDKSIRLWEMGDKPKQAHKLTLKGGACSVAFAPDGKTLAAGCNDGTLRLFKIGEKIEEQDTVSEGKGNFYQIAYSPDGKSLLALVKWDQIEDRTFVWNTEGGKPIYEGKHGRHIEAIAFDPSGKQFVIVNETSLFVVRP